MPVTNNVLFRDLNVTFNKHPVTGKLSVLQNNQSVERAVRNIILTNHYERPFQPFVGANLRAQLFEPLDSITLFEMKRSILQALKNYEPRVIVHDVVIQGDEERNGVAITITFRVNNQVDPVTTSVFLERVR